MALIFICLGAFLLIIDPQTALSGAGEGMELCIKTVIPSLLPFFFISVLLTSHLSGKKIRFLQSLGKLLRIPAGMESVFLIGLLGGYPVGAQSVAQCYQIGKIEKKNAQRMLGFCSNAGPSFIFGILGGMFSSPAAAWVLWLIHILSAILVGVILPGGDRKAAILTPGKTITAAEALERAAKIMANVCGWVILFRVVIRFLDRWILWIFPPVLRMALIGALELTNGCCLLPQLENEGLRFVLASCFIAFGGSCVIMQTAAVTGNLGAGWYFPGKMMQTLISFLMATLYQYLFFPAASNLNIRPIMLCTAVTVLFLMIIFLKKYKISSSIPAISGV